MDLVLESRAMAHDLKAPGNQPTFAFGGSIRCPDFRQVPSGSQACQRPCIDLVGLHVGMGDRFDLAIPPGCSRSPRSLPRPSRRGDCPDPRAPTESCRPDQGAGEHRSPRSPPRQRFDGCLFRRRVACSLSRVDDGSGGRHDTYGFALAAQPGESQWQPANNTSSQLMVRIVLPAPSCSRGLCPGWSNHTLQLTTAAAGCWPRPSHTG